MIVTSKERILRAALQLFLEHGYKDVSYDMLMKKTSFSKGAIYHHFKSKDELLASVFDFLLQNFLDNAAQFPKEEIADYNALKKHITQTKVEQIEFFIQMLEGQPVKLNKLLFFVEALSENSKLIETVNKIFKQEMLFLENCISNLKRDEGLLKKENAAIWAEILFLILQGAEMRMFLSGGEVTEKDFMEAYNKAFSDFEKLIHISA